MQRSTRDPTRAINALDNLNCLTQDPLSGIMTTVACCLSKGQPPCATHYDKGLIKPKFKRRYHDCGGLSRFLYDRSRQPHSLFGFTLYVVFTNFTRNQGPFCLPSKINCQNRLHEGLRPSGWGLRFCHKMQDPCLFRLRCETNP